MAQERIKVGLAFLERSGGVVSLEDSVSHFLDAIGVFGFDVCAAGAFVGIRRSHAYRFYFNTWPKAWLDIYEAQGLFHNDPIVTESRRRMTPFSWKELARHESFARYGAEVVGVAHRFGWREVYAVPVHGPFGYTGLVSLAAYQTVTLTAAEQAMLRTMAVAIHDRCHGTVGFGRSTHPAPDLSLREIECMQWAAAGKTDGEIATILNISKATTHFHVEQVKKKLKVHSRTEAVALLALGGLI